MTTTKRWIAALLVAVLSGGAGAGCRGESKEPECVDPPAEAAKPDPQPTKVERFGLGRAGDEDKEQKDWCRACVMSKLGYASCQKVYADQPDVPRDDLRARARAKGCADAKFPSDACPDSAVISLLCKGDPPPSGTPDPGTALQNLHQALSEGKLPAAPPADTAGASSADAAPPPVDAQ